MNLLLSLLNLVLVVVWAIVEYRYAWQVALAGLCAGAIFAAFLVWRYG